MVIFCGLLAAFAWGAADFYVTRLARRVGSRRAMLLVQLPGAVAALGLALALGAWPHAGPAPWLLAAALGGLNFIAVALLYWAFQYGTLSLVSPIASSYVIVTALLCVFSGQRTPGGALLGAVLLCAGVALITRPAATPVQPARPRGLAAACLAALLFGVIFFGVDRTVPALGMYWPLVLLRLMALLGAGIQWLATGRRQPAPPLAGAVEGADPKLQLNWSLAGLVALAAGGDTLAWLAFNAGSHFGQATALTALSSLFSAVTVLLAQFFLHDRLTRSQWAGVAVVLVGVLAVCF